jgi:hypothetical protein
VLSSGCITERYKESQDVYRWRLAGVDSPRTLVAGSVRLGPDGTPWAVRLRVMTDKGEIVDYCEGASGKLTIVARGFEAPSSLHRTGNTPLVAIPTDNPELSVGTPARHVGREGGELSTPAPLSEEEARLATFVIFKGPLVTVLAPPPGGRRLESGRVLLLHDRGRSFALERPRRGKWVMSKSALARYYAFIPFVLALDAATFPVSVTGLLLHDAGLDGPGQPVIGHERCRLAPWEPPEPPLVDLHEDEARE